MDVNVNGVNSNAMRVNGGGEGMVYKVSEESFWRTEGELHFEMEEEHSRLLKMIQKRRNILLASIAWEKAENEYMRDWSEWRGIR